MEENAKWIVIGDIHGCPDQLLEVLAAAKKYPSHRLIFLGDYIDRGPHPEEVVRLVKAMNAVHLRGNHEQMLLDRIEYSAEMKHAALKAAAISDSSLEWIRTSTIGKYETRNYVFVHAGLNSKKTMEEQTDLDYIWSINDGGYLKLTKKIVVHGHLVVPEMVRVENRININTGCGCGGHLTGLVLPEMELLKSSPSPGHGQKTSGYRGMPEDDVGEI